MFTNDQIAAQLTEGYWGGQARHWDVVSGGSLSVNITALTSEAPAMGEAFILSAQGKVLVRVLIGVDGTAQKAEIKQSSGFDRLDQAALNTVLRWRYVPGKRAGVPETMWFSVPINFVLE